MLSQWAATAQDSLTAKIDGEVYNLISSAFYYFGDEISTDDYFEGVVSYLDLEWDLISRMLTDAYKGIATRLSEEEK